MIRRDRLDTAGNRPASGIQPRHAVVLARVDVVGLHLAVSLLEAGCAVFGRVVDASCRAAFEVAGGRELKGDLPDHDSVWSIKCREQADLRHETLAMLRASRSSYGRPRLELTGSQHIPAGAAERTVAVLQVSPAQESSSLRVVLHVSSRGPELTVQGERSVFERALPILTYIADRVLYSGADSGPERQWSG